VSWSFSVRGLKPRDRDRIEINLSEPTLPKVHHSNIEEDHHGQQEEESSEEEVEVSDWRRPRIGAALSTSDFARSDDLAKRPDQGSAAFVLEEARRQCVYSLPLFSCSSVMMPSAKT
jgi:hypothetical protein